MNCLGLIMAGGRSSRMRAGGCATHKALRSVSGVTLLEHNIARLCQSGIKELWLAVSSSEVELRTWAESYGASITATFGGTIRMVREEDPLGTIGAVRCVPACRGNVLVVNVDNLCDLDLRALVQYHIHVDAALTVATHDAFFRIPFGQVIAQNGRILAYREKPQLPVTISSGIYLLSRRAIEQIPPNRRTDVPELVNWLVDIGESVACFQHSAPWIDVNDENALAEAELFFGPKAECRAAGT
ncbi:MAG TPA: sugar phosphate nucleotidyltransferase [Bryobacteraceae bacterium]|jgi:NDP-sugar pyrophosphorylase family protein